MANKDKQTPSRIPVRFVDGEQEEDEGVESPGAGAAAGPEADELGLGLESAYADDEIEVELREDADDLPAEGGEGEVGDGARQTDPASGPMLAELVATRAELRRIEVELEKLREERKDYADTTARRQADFENYRKRVERERAETYSRAVGDVVSRLFPVLDNLRRALDAEASFKAGESEEFRHFLQGVELIGKQLNDVLANFGVEAVPTVGRPFDPHIHEAVSTEETDEFEPDTVIEEMQRGYRLGDRLLRPAMVKVATR